MSTPSGTPLHRLAAVTLLVGVGAGLGGMALALILHFVQHLAYGYSIGVVISQESFLEGVSASPPMRRVLVLALCGLAAGVGWWTLYRLGRPLVSIGKALRTPAERMPLPETLFHTLLQIITVGLGSPLGREVAPREVGAALAGWLCSRAGLTTDDSRIMIACGAGAGLAAVYNVPFAGALFILEGLLGTVSLSAVLPAIATSVIAALVAWIGLGDEVQYPVMAFTISPSLVIWSIVAGPIFGVAAYGFTRLAAAIGAKTHQDWRLVPACLLVFTLIGVLAISFPQLLGNGKGPIQLGFANELTIGLAATLLVLRLIVTMGALGAGAHGGLLTPGMTIGALLATIVGGLWTLVWPGDPLGAFAIIGAVAFLSSSIKMPLTAIALIVELTHVNHDFLFPILFAVAGSIAASRLCARRFEPVNREALAHAVTPGA